MKQKGFTVVELLIVISVIGILTTIILTALGSARAKSKEAAIQSSLSSMISQIELSYDTTNNYSNACTSIQELITSINDKGATASCYSYNYPLRSDVYRRWGVSALINTFTPIQAYSTGLDGVVTWDTQGVNSLGVFVSPDIGINWTDANAACITSGGRLPTVEELKSLSDAMYSVATTYTPPGFLATRYWSSTVVPSASSTHYSMDTSNGAINGYPVTSQLAVRCVR